MILHGVFRSMLEGSVAGGKSAERATAPGIFGAFPLLDSVVLESNRHVLQYTVFRVLWLLVGLLSSGSSGSGVLVLCGSCESVN